MPIITCPHCQARLNAPDSALGSEVVCGQCQQRFLAVSQPPAAAPEQPAWYTPQEPHDPSRPAQSPPPPPPHVGGFVPPPPNAYGAPEQFGQLPPSGAASAALPLGIISIVAGCCCWPVGLVCGILAIIFGNNAMREIDAGRASQADRGKANAGRICGIIGLVLSILNLVVTVINLSTGGFNMSRRFRF